MFVGLVTSDHGWGENWKYGNMRTAADTFTKEVLLRCIDLKDTETSVERLHWGLIHGHGTEDMYIKNEHAFFD